MTGDPLMKTGTASRIVMTIALQYQTAIWKVPAQVVLEERIVMIMTIVEMAVFVA